ncbi:MAG TPA: hypothetical protein VFQ30_07340, partial [Ktedonobacteraceae bacterium]|nr:hypothetical protein [Ktedonobacteraceae bacterium]
VQRFTSASPTPVPTLIPGDDKFFIEASPPWGTVTVDGHALKTLSSPGFGKPLQLSRGTHIIAWHADPFPPEVCNVYIPSLVREPCQYEGQGGSNGSPRVISFSATLGNLSQSQRTALVAVSQAVLAKLQASETALPGELYARFQPPQSATTVTVNQTLHATLHYHLDTDPNSNRSCNPYGNSVCSFSSFGNQGDCHLFCTLNFFNSSSASRGENAAWEVAAFFYPTWDYSTASGRSLAQGQPDGTSVNNLTTDYSIFLNIRRVGQTWQVSANTAASNNSVPASQSQAQACSAIHKQLTGILDGCITLTSNNPACASFENQVDGNTSYTTTEVDKVSVNWNIVPARDPAQGCVAAIVPAHDTVPATTPHPQVAYCMYRFGVLLAANSLAHHYWPDLPVADSYEQSIAQQTGAGIGL